MPQLLTQPSYKKLIASATPANNIYNLEQIDDHSGNNAIVNNPNVLDIDLVLNSMTINLFALSTLFFGDSMGLGFTIKGTITATTGGLGRALVIYAYSSEAEVNTICGNATATITGTVGNTFILTPAGMFNWLLLSCAPTVS